MPTEGDPIPLGTIQLRDLCGCPDECVDCCINCGCSGMADTLYATITNLSGCGGFSEVVTLTYDSLNQRWNSGVITLGCGDTIEISFLCRSGGTTCNDLRAVVTWPCAGLGGGAEIPPTTCNCEPFEFNFTLTGFYPLTGCSCCASGIVQFSFSITE